MFIYLFKVGCFSKEDIATLKADSFSTLLSNPENKGSWYTIYSDADDFDKYEMSFDKMSIQPVSDPEDLKCSYDDAEEDYTFLIALKTEEILYMPAFIYKMQDGTSFENLFLLYPAETFDDEEIVCYEQWVDGEWDEGYFIGERDLSCTGDAAGEVLGITPMEEFINPENYT